MSQCPSVCLSSVPWNGVSVYVVPVEQYKNPPWREDLFHFVKECRWMNWTQCRMLHCEKHFDPYKWAFCEISFCAFGMQRGEQDDEEYYKDIHTFSNAWGRGSFLYVYLFYYWKVYFSWWNWLVATWRNSYFSIEIRIRIIANVPVSTSPWPLRFHRWYLRQPSRYFCFLCLLKVLPPSLGKMSHCCHVVKFTASLQKSRTTKHTLHLRYVRSINVNFTWSSKALTVKYRSLINHAHL